jgi:hypothetical protein
MLNIVWPEGFGGGMLKQGWLAYDLILKWNSSRTHLKFELLLQFPQLVFSINYYILEDDHDGG